jgi:trehalose synthase
MILAGGGASDDPEGNAIYQEVEAAAKDDPDLHVLLLPENPRLINALQRGSTIILQKSIREGFGLTVTEALWKNKAVIGGNTGGIRRQILDHVTGFLVYTPEGAAHRIRQLLQKPELGNELGIKGKRLVKENFLITRHLREYLTLMATLLIPNGDRIDLSTGGRGPAYPIGNA